MKIYGIKGISAITAAAVMMAAAQPALAGVLDGIDEYSTESGYECSVAVIPRGALDSSTAFVPFTGDTGRIYHTAGTVIDEKCAKHIAEIAKYAVADPICGYSPYPIGWLSYTLGRMIASWLFE